MSRRLHCPHQVRSGRTIRGVRKVARHRRPIDGDDSRAQDIMSADTLVAVSIGLGLAASAGMRVFLPLFVLALAGAADVVPLAENWQWLGSTAALIGLGTAMLLEIGAYYVPWLDHALDVVATPAALMAGMIATASVLIDVPPMLKWAVVIVGGGGVAGLTQGASVLVPMVALLLVLVLFVFIVRRAGRVRFGRRTPKVSAPA